jgi:hypothetical protein
MMTDKKKRMIYMTAFAGAVLIFITIGVVYVVTKSFAVDVILHGFVQFLLTFALVKWIGFCFKNHITKSMKKVLVICGGAIFLDLVILDTLRFGLSGSISTILFFPFWLPVCLMVVLYYMYQDAGEGKKWAWMIGLPLLLLSVVVEILSFIR